MRTAILDSVARATPRTRRLRLTLAGGAFPFRAGQAVVAGLAGAATRAPYSIASPPSLGMAGALELLVPADGAFGQAGLDPATLTGATLEVEGPIGGFGVPDAAGAGPLLLVAGGTGISPIRSVILDRLDQPGCSPATLVYSVRATDDFAFADELAALAGDGRLVLHPTITRDDGPADQPTRLGRVDAALLRAALPNRRAWCLVCGPAGFVETVTATLEELGVPPEHIVVER
ncbi:MAG: FAD-dependent oxidoreductase [Acidobacteria bacterium]|nr:FAD-dependent oxidoreductase [Acidobacteriota bacterium]